MKFLQSISEELFGSKYMINGEISPDQVFKDIAEEIAGPEKPSVRKEIQKLFENMMIEGYFIPGGRILANARSYGHPKSRNYNNCFTIDIDDSMEGIYNSVLEDAMISRMGGGVGFDISKLRPEGSQTSNGGEASGPISFLRVFDASAKTISSGGFRRAAHIALLDIDHPDIEKFITAKQGDKDKKLSQFNISVRLTDKFMQAVEKDEDWNLQFEGRIYKTMKAKDLYNALATNAYKHNDPGCFFIDRVERDNNAWWAFKMDRCNPCGEIPMPPYSLCCLGALNLTKFIVHPFTKDAYFDYEKAIDVIHLAIRFLDNVLDATEYPLDKIEKFSKQWRRVGLGFTGLGDAIAMLGHKYGDNESITFCRQFGQVLRDESYTASVNLAMEKGMAPALKTGVFKKKPDPRLLESQFIKTLPFNLRIEIEKYGLRNIGLNTAAPTGTISLTVGNNCSSGIEPIFALEYDRNIRTGKDEETKKETVRDYAWLLYRQQYAEAYKANTNGTTLADDAEIPRPDYFVTTEEIDPYRAIDVQAALQEYIDHSISKTINLPKGYSFEQYKDLFFYAYKKGLKGITSFNPDGSMKGVLETNKTPEVASSFIMRAEAPKRPDILPCDIHYVHANSQDFIVLVGMLNGSVYEIFVDEQNGHDLKAHKTGKIVRQGKGEYDLLDNDGTVLVKGLSKNFHGTWGILTRFISLALRKGEPLQKIIEQLQRSKEFLGFEKAVSRVLKHYIKEGEVYELPDEKCPLCGGTMQVVSGCPTCRDCGHGRCS